MKRKLVLLVVLSGVLLLPWAAGWLAADQLAHPPRRALQDYHAEFLADPTAHGVVVKAFTCADGTPCLMCEPAANAHPGKRGEAIRAQLAESGAALRPFGEVCGTLVLVHGRRGRKEDYLLVAERFCAAGFRCVMPDLPAHGEHPGPLACYGVQEGRIPAMVLREAAAEFGFDPRPAGIMGLSMGGAVSVRSAAQDDAPWQAAVLVSTFDSLDTVVHHQCAQIAGQRGGQILEKITGWMFERMAGFPPSAADSTAVAVGLRCPVLMAHGTTDRVIPIASGRQLFEKLPTQIGKDWIDIPDADHDNVLITDFPIYARMAGWMLLHVKTAE